MFFCLEPPYLLREVFLFCNYFKNNLKKVRRIKFTLYL